VSSEKSLDAEKSSLKEKSLKEIQNMAKKNLNEELHDKLSNKQLLTNDLYSYYNYAVSQLPPYNCEKSQEKQQQHQQLHDSTKYPDYNYAYNLYKESEKKLAEKQQQQPQKSAESETKQQKSAAKQNGGEKPTIAQQKGKPSTTVTGSQKTTAVKTAACSKRFSIGNYAHLLNEPVVPPPTGHKHEETESITGEQIIDKYYNTLKGKNNANSKKVDVVETKMEMGQRNGKKSQQQQQQHSESTNLTSNDVGKIAANIVSSGKSKWKNSAKPTANETS
jgi:hypothetical protein